MVLVCNGYASTWTKYSIPDSSTSGLWGRHSVPSTRFSAIRSPEFRRKDAVDIDGKLELVGTNRGPLAATVGAGTQQRDQALLPHVRIVQVVTPLASFATRGSTRTPPVVFRIESVTVPPYIRARTPRLNGKVERSHRVDSQEFSQLLDRTASPMTFIGAVEIQSYSRFRAARSASYFSNSLR